MQEDSNQIPGYGRDETWLRVAGRYVWSHRDLRQSIVLAILLLTWDAGICGSCVISCLLCPIAFLFGLVKSLIARPGLKLSLLQIAIPVLTLVLVLANNSVQLAIANANAEQVVAACDGFYAANGTLPKSLDELVPQHLTSVPRAKYCLLFGNFVYFGRESPTLMWYVVPPFGRKSYNFKAQEWSYMD